MLGRWGADWSGGKKQYGGIHRGDKLGAQGPKKSDVLSTSHIIHVLCPLKPSIHFPGLPQIIFTTSILIYQALKRMFHKILKKAEQTGC